jgi:hypothetical protein
MARPAAPAGRFTIRPGDVPLYAIVRSRAILRRHHQEGLFLGVEPTKSGRKRTSALECRLLEVDRTYLGHGWKVRV